MQGRAAGSPTWMRHRPLELWKGDHCGLVESREADAIDAAERGMATLAGITYSPWTSYLHVPAPYIYIFTCSRTVCNTTRTEHALG